MELIIEVIDFVHARIVHALNFPLKGESRIFWMYLAVCVPLALFSYLYYRQHKRGEGLAGFLKFMFPKSIYTHPSTWLDVKLYFVNFISAGVLAPLIALATASVIAYEVNVMLGKHFSSPNFDLGYGNVVLFTLLFFLFKDFMAYVNHRLHHVWPVLWPIHSVHHSAEVLMPLTVYRIHPLYRVTSTFFKGPIVGLFQGALAFLFLGEVGLLTMFGINIVYGLFNIGGSVLRHTHIWLSYGDFLNHIFCSPAHHQLHHSAREEHWYCNFGEVLSIWDYLFGSLVLPSEELRKNLKIGLNQTDPDRHQGVVSAYIEPLGRMWRSIKRMANDEGATVVREQGK